MPRPLGSACDLFRCGSRPKRRRETHSTGEARRVRRAIERPGSAAAS